MTKYNSSFKQQVIEFYLQKGKNRSFTCQHFQLPKTTFDRWLSQYNHNGINGLVVRGKKQIYSLDVKLSVIQAVKNGQYSAREACLRFGIANSSVISQWLHAFIKANTKDIAKSGTARYAIDADIKDNRFYGKATALDKSNKGVKYFYANSDKVEGGFYGMNANELAGSFLTNDNSVFAVFGAKSEKMTNEIMVDAFKVNIEENEDIVKSNLNTYFDISKLVIDGQEVPLANGETTLSSGDKISVSACCGDLKSVKFGTFIHKSERHVPIEEEEEDNFDDEETLADTNEELADNEGPDEGTENENDENISNLKPEEDLVYTKFGKHLFIQGHRTPTSALPTDQTFTYEGNWQGHAAGKKIAPVNFSPYDSKAKFVADFAAKKVTGELIHNAVPVVLIESDIDKNGFKGYAKTGEFGITLDKGNTLGVSKMEFSKAIVEGAFYGKNAEEIGGSVYAQDPKFGAVYHDLIKLSLDKTFKVFSTKHNAQLSGGVDFLQSRLDRKDYFEQYAIENYVIKEGSTGNGYFNNPYVYQLAPGGRRVMTETKCNNLSAFRDCNTRIIKGNNKFIALREHINVNKYLDIGLGGRIDSHRFVSDDPWTASKNYTTRSWNLGVVVKPTRNIALSYRVSNGFRVPSFQEMFGHRVPGFERGEDDEAYKVSNLRPEKSLNREVGIGFKGDFGSLEASYFINQYNDLITLAAERVYNEKVKRENIYIQYNNAQNIELKGINVVGKIDWNGIYDKLPEGLYTNLAYITKQNQQKS